MGPLEGNQQSIRQLNKPGFINLMLLAIAPVRSLYCNLSNQLYSKVIGLFYGIQNLEYLQKRSFCLQGPTIASKKGKNFLI